MTEPSLALQRALRARLITSPGVTSLVAVGAILDRSGRPEAFPCILIADAQAMYADRISSFHEKVFATLHVWSREEGLAGVKAIVGTIRDCLRYDRHDPLEVPGFDCRHLLFASAQFMRDPDAIHSHAVVTVEATLMQQQVETSVPVLTGGGYFGRGYFG